MKGDHWTEQELQAEVDRLIFIYDGKKDWAARFELWWMWLRDQEAWALTDAAWRRIEE